MKSPPKNLQAVLLSHVRTALDDVNVRSVDRAAIFKRDERNLRATGGHSHLSQKAACA